MKRKLTFGETIERLEIASDMYYNNNRYQWNLKKMTPAKYRNHLLELSV